MTDGRTGSAATRAVRAAAAARTAQRQRWLLYALGVIGWGLLLANMPFDWELPTYATY
jgi:hypothetical protein